MIKEKHDNIVNGGGIGGTALLILSVIAILAFKILIVNNM
nr:MAG TPA: hypothetical protein [Caudoviricetes sp.]